MPEQPTATDAWHKWLLERRSGGDANLARIFAAQLAGVRDRVLRYADIHEGDTLLDVGSGDGLIAFGALDRVGAGGRVIFSDISQPLLDHTRALAEGAGVLDRCQFVLASADDLSAIAGASVDVVTTRSVLIYVKAKRRCFQEFLRVLRPGGRISLFEPINRIDLDDRAKGQLWGIDMTPVQDLADRLSAVYFTPEVASGPMLDFDERDLVRMAEDAGFGAVQLRLDYSFSRRTPVPGGGAAYDALVNAAPNPLAPTPVEAMQRIFTPEERARFEAHVRPLIASGERWQRSAVA
jgi:ubiquinone/menaquinone biosynthesis C-methylase UbiE